MPKDFEGYLKIDGVTSESKEPDHEEWIDIESFSFGCAAGDITLGDEGKLEAEDSSVEPFSFTGGMHKGSPTLFKFCVMGEQIDTVEFHVRKAGGDPLIYFEVKLFDS